MNKGPVLFTGPLQKNPLSAQPQGILNNQTYSASTTSASGAFFFTDSMPFMHPDFDL
jgi:hypothetical protein